jgi:putative hemolysin
METLILWAAGVVLLAVAFFLSLLYASFAACSISRLEAIAAERRRLGRAKRLIPQLHRLTASLLVLKYLAELGLVAIILLGPLLHPLTGEAGTALHVAIDLAAAAAVIVVICELIPHSLAEQRGEQIVLSLGGAARALSFAAAPGIWLDRFIEGITRTFLPDRAGNSSRADASEDVLDAVSEQELAGTIRLEEKEMIRSIISLRGVEVAEIMTPRPEIAGLDASMTPDEALERTLSAGYSRFPIYRGSRDHILGVVHVKDLIREARTKSGKSLEQIASPPYFVPETTSIAELLREFQAKNLHLAVVVDEYGGTSGIVSIEDILEEIVGEIEDEYDTRTKLLYDRLDEHTVEADGRCRVDDLNEVLHIAIPTDAEYDTIGGFAVSRLGRIPRKDETFELGDVTFEVLEADERRVKKMKVHVPPESPTI